MMHTNKLIAAVLLALLFASTGIQSNAVPADDPTKKLGAFLGKWELEGAFANGDKVSSKLNCQWSPQSSFLVCEQLVTMASGETRQLTIYAYNPKNNSYSYTTISEPGGKPSLGNVEIKGNVWIYDSSYQSDGKTTQVHNTNEFTDPKTEVFKIVTSDDGGAHWKPMLDGNARKIAD
jgi:hypothetical protein